MRHNYPIVLTQAGTDLLRAENHIYVQAAERILSHIFPPTFFFEEEALQRFHRQLPMVCWTSLSQPPFEISFFLCCRFRANAFRFFYEMVSRWLIPGKNLNALLQFAVDFTIPAFGKEKYIGGEVMIRIENEKEFEVLKKNLPVVESEIRLGVDSSYQAGRILEIKGLNSDEKTALIQENIVSLIRHRPQDFDYGILSEMQHFFVLCKEEFKFLRCYRHMSRIICIHYLFKKALKFSLEIYPERRYISVKLVRAQLKGCKRVLGIALALSFLRDNELLEAGHIVKGVQAIIPDSKLVPGSYFLNKGRSEPACAMYLEIEKENGSNFSLEEERLLKADLPSELKSRIEQRLNPIFMPQNEEEIMRHILTLSHQLKFVRDLPQIIIDFNQQTEDSLEFIVILLRIILPGTESLESLLKRKFFALEYFADRTKIVGSLRKKYQKEANVFRVRIQKKSFLRQDHSVDLYKARQEVVKELTESIGEFRDYNGGIIAKETELFEALREKIDEKHTYFLENFFYSLSPPVMRSVLSLDAIKRLFFMVVEAKEVGFEEPYQISIKEDCQYHYFLLLAKDGGFQNAIASALEECSGCVATFFLTNSERPYFGALVYKEHGLKFKLKIEQVMLQWAENFALHV